MEKKKAPAYEMVTLPVSKVKLWKENPRRNEVAIHKLEAIIKIHGVRSPLVVWKKNMTVYKGNTTLKACMNLGIKEIPVVLADFADEKSAIAYAIADNKASEWAEWDDKILVNLLTDRKMLNTEGLQASLGFGETEFKSLIAPPMTEAEKETKLSESAVTVSSENYIMIYFDKNKALCDTVKKLFKMPTDKKVVKFDAVQHLILLTPQKKKK